MNAAARTWLRIDRRAARRRTAVVAPCPSLKKNLYFGAPNHTPMAIGKWPASPESGPLQELSMSKKSYRKERDSMGELHVPDDALWGAQTQRAVDVELRSHGWK